MLSMCPTADCTGGVGTQQGGPPQPAGLACPSVPQSPQSLLHAPPLPWHPLPACSSLEPCHPQPDRLSPATSSPASFYFSHTHPSSVASVHLSLLPGAELPARFPCRRAFPSASHLSIVPSPEPLHNLSSWPRGALLRYRFHKIRGGGRVGGRKKLKLVSILCR